jgi:hypothetical protein
VNDVHLLAASPSLSGSRSDGVAHCRPRGEQYRQSLRHRGWDRTARGASLPDRLARARDVPLDGPAADRSVRLRRAASVSVVDATVGQAAEAAGSPTVILTSDVADMARLAGLVAGEVRAVRI